MQPAMLETERHQKNGIQDIPTQIVTSGMGPTLKTSGPSWSSLEVDGIEAQDHRWPADPFGNGKHSTYENGDDCGMVYFYIFLL